jgi:triacylglycerol esterase/lipase EstA (alpha/beta hydrolase family)
MLARYIRFMLLLELAAYVAIAEYLRFLYGWSYAWLALASIAAMLAGRFAMVCTTTAIGFLARSPRERDHHIGLMGTAVMLVREFRAALATSLFFFPWDRLALRPDPPAEPTGRIPIVMVHGYFSNRGYFRPLVRALESRGVAPIFTPNLLATFATIEQFADDLEREIERITGATGQPQVILVCHSMGGLAARFYICRHGTAHVKKLVTIASPHHGTVHARFGAGPNARQMRRESVFLGELCEKEGERGPECGVTSIYTPHDNLVAPQDTSRLAWARNIAIPGRGHIDILGSERLLAVLVKELRECGVEVRD